jgi:hypothetical protein
VGNATGCGRATIAALMLLALLQGGAFADEIVLENGTSIKGQVLEDNARELVVAVRFGKIGGKIILPRASVKSVLRGTLLGAGKISASAPLPDEPVVSLGTEEPPPDAPATPPTPEPAPPEAKALPSTGPAPDVHAAPGGTGDAAPAGGSLGSALENVKKVLPRDPVHRALVGLLLFFLSLALLHLGCRFLDIEAANFGRCLVMNAVTVIVLLVNRFLLPVLHDLAGGALVVLGSLLTLVVSSNVVFKERFFKSFLLVGFLIFAFLLAGSCVTAAVLTLVGF